MENNQYNKFYLKKSVGELIGQLRDHRITGQRLDKLWYEALITHLSEREISDEERQLIDNILNTDPEILRSEEVKDAFQTTLNGTERIQTKSEIVKYPALRTICGILTTFAWAIGVLTILSVLNFITYSGWIYVLPILIIGGLLVLSTLAFSELIKVIIDIECNTRKTANNQTGSNIHD